MLFCAALMALAGVFVLIAVAFYLPLFNLAKLPQAPIPKLLKFSVCLRLNKPISKLSKILQLASVGRN